MAAAGETAAIFADIRQALDVDVANLICRHHLATIDGALLGAWGARRSGPFGVDGSVRREFVTLYRKLALPPVPAILAEVFAGQACERTN